ncbi:MAG: universal stress protein [Cyanobacteria bacterium P01_A01_bin.40]
MFNKILVAIDHSAASEQVLNKAISIAQADQADLMLLHVLSVEAVDSPMMSSYLLKSRNRCIHVDSQILHDANEIFEREWSDFMQRGIQLLRSYAQKAIAANIKTEYSQITGRPGATICEFAHACNADVIVIGRRGYSGLQELLLGSVSNHVVHHAPCSIFLVQTPIPPQNAIKQVEEMTVYA